jgi:hypothetical protein
MNNSELTVNAGISHFSDSLNIFFTPKKRKKEQSYYVYFYCYYYVLFIIINILLYTDAFSPKAALIKKKIKPDYFHSTPQKFPERSFLFHGDNEISAGNFDGIY